jgi:GntR family transcriptional regulator
MMSIQNPSDRTGPTAAGALSATGTRDAPVLAANESSAAATGAPRTRRTAGRSKRSLAGVPPVDPPLYEQAYASLAEMIAAGAYRPGSRLPSERALCGVLGVSRLTLRHALASLVEAGVLQRRASRGWYVAGGPVTGATNELLSFVQMALDRGLVPSSRVLQNTTRPATFEESQALRIAPGAPVYDIERLRLLDGIPISVDTSIIPVARAPWLGKVDLRTASLYASLEERDLVPTAAEYTITLREADERLAGLLEVEPGNGLLHAFGITRDQLGQPFELAQALYRPDRYRIQITLTRSPGSRGTP